MDGPTKLVFFGLRGIPDTAEIPTVAVMVLPKVAQDQRTAKLQTCATGGARTRGPQITRQAS